MPTPALKEWDVIVHALEAGEQIIDLRKGGLREDGRHFGLHARRFWWYPTFVHQRAELVKPAYRDWVSNAEPDDRSFMVSSWADVVAVAELTEPAQVEALDSKTIWSPEYAESRLAWKRRDPLTVLVCRVHRLIVPIDVPFRDEYGGCTSWVDLADLPDDPALVASEPALSDTAFAARAKSVSDALQGAGASFHEL